MIAVIGGVGNNLNSVLFALDRLRIPAKLTTRPKKIREASHVILPGVGHARHGMEQLAKMDLIDTIKQLQQPVLGICLGMQLLFEHSEEGETDCLGIIPGVCKRLIPDFTTSVPHMGWNVLNWEKKYHPLQKNIEEDDHFYFVHSYAVPISEHTVASCSHGQDFSAIVNYRNFCATQFHPERSGSVGEQLLLNFSKL